MYNKNVRKSLLKYLEDEVLSGYSLNYYHTEPRGRITQKHDYVAVVTCNENESIRLPGGGNVEYNIRLKISVSERPLRTSSVTYDPDMYKLEIADLVMNALQSPTVVKYYEFSYDANDNEVSTQNGNMVVARSAKVIDLGETIDKSRNEVAIDLVIFR